RGDRRGPRRRRHRLGGRRLAHRAAGPGLVRAVAGVSFLVTALFVTAAAAGRLGPRRARLVTAALLVGLLATMSRAGLAALVIGGLVVALAVSARWGSQQGDIPPTQSQRCHPAAARTRQPSAWRSLAALWPAVPGAAVAAAGLLPGLAEGSAPRPLLAVAALAAGLGFAALTPHRHAAVPTPDHAAAGHAPDPAAARHAPDPTAAMRASASR